MNLETEQYLTQKNRWPASGRHILAQYDEETIVVYQAYRPSIGKFAAEHGCFGGEFSYSRMSWIKPNFLWMMFRSGWGQKPGQEVTLAIRLSRLFFDRLLVEAVPSTFIAGKYESNEVWKSQVAKSAVRLQWDPDHGPSGDPVERRAIQLGLRGPLLAEYGREGIVEIEDISLFVSEQKAHVENRRYEDLLLPKEQTYLPEDTAASNNIGLDVK